jgi:1-acyl-sn-glycerol-3-phosphate acyltransferase
MKHGKIPRPNRLMVSFIQNIMLKILKRRYSLEAVDSVGMAGLKPPYVIVANHVNFWDPFWVNTFVPVPIQFVTSDNLFRTFLFGLAMKLVGSIPKSKLMNDPETVVQIFRVIGAGGVVGIFPEGVRSYDGRSSEPIRAVAKLIRKLKVPVVGVRIEGGYLSRPRWAREVRYGKVKLSYETLFTPLELRNMDADAVFHRMKERLSFDESAVQRRRMIRFRSRRPAEYLERLLFVCPRCGSVSSLVSNGNRLTCNICAHAVTVDEYGFMKAVWGRTYFETPAEWNAWQLGELPDILRSRSSSGKPIFVEDDAALLKGYRRRPLSRLESGSAALYPDGILVKTRKRGEILFSIDRIEGVNVQNGEKLEFYHGGELFRIEFRDPRASSFKWERALGLLKGCEPGTCFEADAI